MDFCGGLVFLPYMRLFQGPLHQFLLSNLDLYDNISESRKDALKKVPICNLFYNGTWQKPVKGKYWINCGDSLWANATMCVHIFCLILIVILIALIFKF